VTNIIKIHQTTANPRFNIDAGVTVLKNVSELWRTESMENKLKLCYTIGKNNHLTVTYSSAHRVADDAQFQESALDSFRWPGLAMDLLHNIEVDDGKGELGFDIAARGREVCATLEPS
jgi:hypothetical protein